jgi:DNA adenine methylase
MLRKTRVSGGRKMGAEWSFANARALLDEWNRRSTSAKPFLKWAGGKRLFLSRFGDMIPVPRRQYVEPFLGSGAVFFHVCRKAGRPVSARLGDANVALIECYLQLQEDPHQVADSLGTLVAGFRAAGDRKRFYEHVRTHYNAGLPRVDAADFIFLNRTCWNGLYRVNQRGEFNVPIGQVAQEKKLYFPTEEDLENAAVALSSSRLRATSWEQTLNLADEDDFVFLDPPYFSDWLRDDLKYSSKAFGPQDHSRLAEAVARLKQRGVGFLLTNSAEPQMIDLYEGHGLDVQVVGVPRAINSDVSARGAVSEIIVTPG